MLVLGCPAAHAAHAAEAAEEAEISGVTVIAPRDDAYQARSTTTATKTDTPLRDVPQAVTVITDELIRDQAMQTMADVVRYVPGVTMGQGEGHRDAPTIRGNATTADFFVNVERWGVNPSIGWRNDAGLTVSLSYEHFEDDRTADRGAPSFAGRPSPA